MDQQFAVTLRCAGGQLQSHRDLLFAQQVPAFEPNVAQEDSVIPQSRDLFDDAHAARPPDGLDRRDSVDQSPARLGAVAEGGERKSSQFNLQRAIDPTGRGIEIDRAGLLGALLGILHVEQQIREGRAEIGAVGLDHHLGTAAAEHEILAAMEKSILV